MKKIHLIIAIIACAGCSRTTEDPQVVVDNSMKISGADQFENTEVQFTFRDKDYGAKFRNDRFEYVRLFKDSVNLYRDVLTNDGFRREINGKKTDLPDSMATKYANSVNSVIYFALLPKGLNDQAVNKEYLGLKKMNGNAYHKIKVTFEEEGGGQDHQDKFIYWINKENNKIDYLAYQYHTDGGGMRFREAYNERIIGDIRFVDYVNYRPKGTTELLNMDEALLNEELEEISRIELRDIRVNKIEAEE